MPFSVDDDNAVLALALGASLYSPATRPALAKDIARQRTLGVRSVVVCLEDAIPDAEVLAMYNALRPRASTGAALEEMADRLERAYSAPVCAALVREAAEVYGRRDLLARPAADSDQ